MSSPRGRRVIALTVLAQLSLISSAGAQISDTTSVFLRISVRSEADGVPPGITVELRDEVGNGIRVGPGETAGAFLAVLRPGTAYRLEVRASGHRPARFALRPEAGGILNRLILLAPDPVELPALDAVVRWGSAASSTRSVSEVRFADSPLRWPDIGSWLSAQPGISLRGSATAGGEFASVRGSRTEGVLVLLDGQPINDPVTGRADLGTVSIGSLESATLVRGAASTRYGSGALAGVLLLRSRTPRDFSTDAALRVSSLGGWGGELNLTGGGPEGRAGLSLSWEEAANRFEYENRLLPGAPVETRSNSDRSRMSANFGLARGRVQLGIRYDAVERGTPGPMGNSLHESARWHERRALGTAGWRSAGARLSAHAGWSGSSWDPGDVREPVEREARRAGLDAEVATDGALGVLAAGRLTWESLAGEEISGRAARVLAGASLSRPIPLGRVSLEPGLSLDGSGGDWRISPELGASVPVDGGLVARARIGQAYRLPTLADLFYAPGIGIRANPDLVPERVRLDAEAGLDGRWPAGTLAVEASITGWYRETVDPIVWLASSVAIWSPRNLDRLESAGLEGSLSVAGAGGDGDGWRATLSGTLDRSRLGFGANRNPVPYQPAQIAVLGVERWSERLSARAELRWTGSRTTSLAGTRELPGFARLDLAFAHALPAGSLPLEAAARIDNLLDARYELVELVPEPGRRFTLTLRLRRTPEKETP